MISIDLLQSCLKSLCFPMRLLIPIVFFLSLCVHGKMVYFADNDGIVLTEMVDPNVEIWFIKQYVFKQTGLNPDRVTLGIQTANGFYIPTPREKLGNFGQTTAWPVMFYFVTK